MKSDGLKSGGLKSAGLKSAGLKSGGLKSGESRRVLPQIRHTQNYLKQFIRDGASVEWTMSCIFHKLLSIKDWCTCLHKMRGDKIFAESV